jgi:hypothetical protein
MGLSCTEAALCRHSREAETQYLLDRDVLDAGIMIRACVAMPNAGEDSAVGDKSADASNNGVGCRHRSQGSVS